MRIAVLASGRGSNLLTMLKLASAGHLDAEICLVLSNNTEAGALSYAKEYGVPTWSRSHKGMSREEFDTLMEQEIKACGAELIVLAGYMRILSGAFIRSFNGRIINIHPAILPSFPGAHGGRDAIDYGVKLAGCTVHFVEEEMDSGPIIIQAVVPCSASDTEDDLMGRIHTLEHRIYPQAVQWLAEGRLSLQGRSVVLAPAKQGANLASTGNENGFSYMVSPALEKF